MLFKVGQNRAAPGSGPRLDCWLEKRISVQFLQQDRRGLIDAVLYVVFTVVNANVAIYFCLSALV